MALREAVLAALLDGEASGYDLSKRFDATVANFWMATPQQLYRELDRLASDGLIVARIVEQDRRPTKRMYSLTETGRQILRAFTASTPKPSVIREDLLVQIRAMDGADTAAVRASLVERQRSAVEKLASYQRLKAAALGDQSEDSHIRETTRIGPYLTLLRGIQFEQGNIEWIRRVLAIIDERASSQAERAAGPRPSGGAACVSS
ncbi:PadR family transcriptional regulator [Mycobacteroides salmoniphilum]|uniref:PadR family transcriptional regulator n=1 Tax=Mycobacteroides salmoniphilum TaxID=404941 RepID=UPI0009920579|nr:PadR family transcriptional regulator [Mycobacteroides salmoniphilum]